MTENNKTKEYAFVLDLKGNKLAPTNTNKAWILIRKKKARLLQKYPIAIQLNYEVGIDEETEIICGIDDGSSHVGIALIQKCKNYNKPIFKGTIELRQDVKGLIDTRRGYRRYKRNHKRYRKARFNNRSSSNRKGRIAPSILQKKQSTVRVINQLLKFINIKKFHLEDVAVDIRALTEGKKLYRWQYQKSNRLELLLRKSEFESTYGDVIIDLTTVNGVTASNRYVKLDYNYGDLDLQSDRIIKEDAYKKEFITMLKYKSCEYLRNNEKVLENSMLPNAHKFLIKSGKVI